MTNIWAPNLWRFQLLRILLVVCGLFFFWWTYNSAVSFFAPWVIGPIFVLLLTGSVVFFYRNHPRWVWFLWFELVIDTLLISLIIIGSGGRNSPLVFLYPLLIFVGTLFLGPRGADMLTGLTLSCYIFIYWVSGPLELSSFNLMRFFITVGGMGLSGLLALRFAEELAHSKQRIEETQAALYQIEELYQHIMRSMASGLIITDLKGVITSSNQKATDILGQDLKGKHLIDVVPGLDLSREQNRGELVLPRGEKKLYLGYSLFPLKDEKDDVFGYGLLFQDITHIKEQEEKLRRAEQQAALGTMAAGLVHEIKNPLASISGAIQLLKEASLVTPQGQRLMNILERSCNRLDELVTNFLFFAKPGSGEKKIFSLKELCGELLEELSCDPALARVKVDLHLPLVKIRGDPGRFKQVLANLLLNAAQALEDTPEPQIEISFIQDQDSPFWRLIVKDNGPGIPERILPRIFEPFFTTKEDGTGLGLSVVYSLVRAWGGHIEVSSQEGKGTTFTLILPQSLLLS